MRSDSSLIVALLTITSLALTLPAQAISKPQAAYPVAGPKAIQAMPVRNTPARPTHPANIESQSKKEQAPKSGKPGKKVSSTGSSGVQLQRYQLRTDRGRKALRRPEPIGVSSSTGLTRHWIAPLPESGHQYLKGLKSYQ